MIGVVVLNWNTRDDLTRCVDSLRRFGSDELYVLVVDNGSVDGSVLEIEPDEKVGLLALRRNIGFARANNLGAAEILRRRPEIDTLAFLNADVRLCAPRTIEQLAAVLREREDIGLVAPRLANPDGSLQPSCAPFPTVFGSLAMACGLSLLVPDRFRMYTGTRWSHSRTTVVPWVKGAALACRRQLWEQIGGFTEDAFMYGEDLDLAWRVHRLGLKTLYVHELVVEHVDDAAAAQIWDASERAARAVDASARFLAREMKRSRRLVALVSLGGSCCRVAAFRLLLQPERARVYAAVCQAWKRAV